MNQQKTKAIILTLINALWENNSWCGETHIQKAAYFLQELTNVPMEFDFILYKHGPFSFDLRDELTSMRADGLLKIKASYPYGHRMYIADEGNFFRKRFPKTIGEHKEKIDYIAKTLGSKSVVELERIATALLITKTEKKEDVEERALRLNELKPHIPVDIAKNAISSVDKIYAQANDQGLTV
jgi:uncharacterized protein YwgA